VQTAVLSDVIRRYYSVLMTFFMSFSSFYKRGEEKVKKQRIKGKTMAQQMKLLWNNSFIN